MRAPIEVPAVGDDIATRGCENALISDRLGGDRVSPRSRFKGVALSPTASNTGGGGVLPSFVRLRSCSISGKLGNDPKTGDAPSGTAALGLGA